MANNLRYLLEHFCLDGQTIDISSPLDEENADKIEKLNNETVPSINGKIDDIKKTDIPNINSRIDNINQKVDTINNTTIPSVQRSVTAVDEKVDRINESVAKNTRDISTLSENVTMQGNAINSINTSSIPHLQEQIDKLSCVTKWIESPQITITNSDGLIFKITHFTNGNLHFIDVICDFSNIENPELNTIYLLHTTDIPLSRKGVYFGVSANFIYNNVGTLSLVSDTSKTSLSLILEKQPNFTSLLNTVRGSFFYF